MPMKTFAVASLLSSMQTSPKLVSCSFALSNFANTKEKEDSFRLKITCIEALFEVIYFTK